MCRFRPVGAKQLVVGSEPLPHLCVVPYSAWRRLIGPLWVRSSGSRHVVALVYSVVAVWLVEDHRPILLWWQLCVAQWDLESGMKLQSLTSFPSLA